MMKKYALLTLALLFTTTACVTIRSGGKTYNLSNLIKGSSSSSSSSGERELLFQKTVQLCKAIHEDDVNQFQSIIQSLNHINEKKFEIVTKNGGEKLYKYIFSYEQLSNMCEGDEIGDDNPYKIDGYSFTDYNKEWFGKIPTLATAAYSIGSCNMAKFAETLQPETYRTSANKILQVSVHKFGEGGMYEEGAKRLKQLIVNTVKCGADINTKINGYYLLDYIDKYTDDVFDKVNRKGKLGELIDILVQLGAKRTGEGQKDLSAKRQDEARAAARRANCEHLYEGRAVKVKECFFGCYYASGFEVVGFSKQRGVASVREGKYGDIKEVFCSDIEE